MMTRTDTTMNLHVVLRRGGWRSAEELEEAAGRSAAAGEEMADEVRWIRSYVLEEGAGTLGTVCLYEATGPEALRRHASRAFLPADEIVLVTDTVIVRPDPVPAGRDAGGPR